MYKCIKDYIKNLNIVIGCKIGCNYCYARNNCKRFHTIVDFENPEFFETKLKLLENKTPHVFLLTGMSDLSSWEEHWRDLVFTKIKENPQNQYIFLTKRPDLLKFETDLDNAWFGVTVTSKADVWKIDELKKNIKAKHYHVTFEPLFNHPGKVSLDGIDWIVIGTMTGKDKNKFKSNPSWVMDLTKTAKELNVPVFWKEDLENVMIGFNEIQEFPLELNKIFDK